MKRAYIGTFIALGLSVVVFLFVYIYTAIGRSMGQEWGSLDGPGQVWPAVLGFGSLNLGALSVAVLLLLIVISLIRAAVRRTRSS
jgi:hypothetical protein